MTVFKGRILAKSPLKAMPKEVYYTASSDAIRNMTTLIRQGMEVKTMLRKLGEKGYKIHIYNDGFVISCFPGDNRVYGVSWSDPALRGKRIPHDKKRIFE